MSTSTAKKKKNNKKKHSSSSPPPPTSHFDYSIRNSNSKIPSRCFFHFRFHQILILCSIARVFFSYFVPADAAPFRYVCSYVSVCRVLLYVSHHLSSAAAASFFFIIFSFLFRSLINLKYRKAKFMTFARLDIIFLPLSLPVCFGLVFFFNYVDVVGP